ncbi:hypothetical protein MICA_1348 [Micavibrio aeruginosavorus ARL-13]|uniref:Uncharacterized protein n=1 Tax=Micavibrio aeruginosavorus (strain ARL-13) TaxID=856793 RepID=G2KSS0_MICAA|nr:hypothetical protein MICA_1348 [Micavibrio aeruginosavorus ARL-13]
MPGSGLRGGWTFHGKTTNKVTHQIRRYTTIPVNQVIATSIP